MSKEKETQQTGKVMTKYDLKKQKKAEAKAQEARALAIWKAVGILFVVAVIALIAYFPIKNVYKAQKTLFTVGNYEISQVEYDYYYNVTKNNYINTYSSILSYMGISQDSDFDTVEYSDNLTFSDYFQKTTAQQLQQNAALKDLIAAEGYTYDSQEHYDEMLAEWKEAAKASDVSLKDYIKANYGSYATANNLKPIIMEAYTMGQYLIKVNEDKTPTDEEIEAYYQENKDSYDLVDYYMTTVSANLPTEPTELADEEPVYSDEGVYSPSQAEIDAAMAEAKANADFIMPTLKEDGSLHTGESADNVTYTIKSWLFDASRKAGDEDIIEGTNMYYLVKFVDRHRKDDVTVTARIIITTEDNGAEIMSEYEAGGANLDSFLAANEKYSSGTAEGGLYENIELSQFGDGDLKTWLSSEERKEGDVANFYLEDGYTYVIYYVGQGDQVWYASAKSDKLNAIMTDYIEEIQNAQVISDPNGFLKYLVVEAAQNAVQEILDATGTETTTDDAATE